MDIFATARVPLDCKVSRQYAVAITMMRTLVTFNPQRLYRRLMINSITTEVHRSFISIITIELFSYFRYNFSFKFHFYLNIHNLSIMEYRNIVSPEPGLISLSDKSIPVCDRDEPTQNPLTVLRGMTYINSIVLKSIFLPITIL